jgi:hypothetical protein
LLQTFRYLKDKIPKNLPAGNLLSSRHIQVNNKGASQNLPLIMLRWASLAVTYYSYHHNNLSIPKIWEAPFNFKYTLRQKTNMGNLITLDQGYPCSKGFLASKDFLLATYSYVQWTAELRIWTYEFETELGNISEYESGGGVEVSSFNKKEAEVLVLLSL